MRQKSLPVRFEIVPRDEPYYERIRRYVEKRLAPILGRKLVGVLLFLPDFAVLLLRILSDPRAPAGRRIASGAMLAYLVTPVDLVPDFLPSIGLVDDVFLLALTVREIVIKTDSALVREHWPSPDMDPLEAVTRTLDRVGRMIPARIRARWMARRFL